MHSMIEWNFRTLWSFDIFCHFFTWFFFCFSFFSFCASLPFSTPFPFVHLFYLFSCSHTNNHHYSTGILKLSSSESEKNSFFLNPVTVLLVTSCVPSYTIDTSWNLHAYQCMQSEKMEVVLLLVRHHHRHHKIDCIVCSFNQVKCIKSIFFVILFAHIITCE